MAKTDKSKIDRFIAEELGYVFQQTPVCLRDIIKTSFPIDQLCYLFTSDGMFWLDIVYVYSEVGGFKYNPRMVFIPSRVHRRIEQKIYRRWYGVSGNVMFRMKPINIQEFMRYFGGKNNTPDELLTTDDEVPLFSLTTA